MAGEPRATLSAAWTPATAVITHAVVPGREPDYQQWSRRLLAAVVRLPGYQGATLVGSPHDEPGRHAPAGFLALTPAPPTLSRDLALAAGCPEALPHDGPY
jgi:hypothetical protein